jgi:Xaa-Pro aminopeptidase
MIITSIVFCNKLGMGFIKYLQIIIIDIIRLMIQLRLNKIRNKLKEWDVEGLLVTNIDNIHYLSGFTGSSAAVIITENEALFLTDGRYITQVQEEVKGFELKGYRGKLLDYIIETVKQLQIKKLGFESEAIVYASFNKLQGILSADGIILVPIDKAIEELRVIKEKGEIQLIEEAIRLAAQALEAIKCSIQPGVRERDLAIELEYQLKKLGGEKTPFDTIVVSGNRSALPHGKPSEKKLEAGEMVTIDWGCTYQGYHADITRTFILAGAKGEQAIQQKKIYHLVLQAQEAAIKLAKPGINTIELDASCRRVIEEAGYGEYFNHGTGHGVGRAVHEDPVITWYNGTTIQEGMVFTLEPGIYIPAWGGVRIEDMVWIKEGRCQVLTQTIEKYWHVLE